jgi:hypothetical protein
VTKRTATTPAPHDGDHRSRHATTADDGRDDVHLITDAVIPLEVDQARRMRRYLIQMGIRVLCFVAAFVAYEIYPNPFLVLGFVAAAAVLPYVAVVGVNAGRERGEGSGAYVTVPHPVLDAPPTRAEDLHPDDDTTAAAGDEDPAASGRYDIEIVLPDPQEPPR